MFPVPLGAVEFGGGVIGFVGTELEVLANISVESSDKGAADCGFLWIVFGKFAEQIVGGTGETGVETSGGEAAAPLQFLHKLEQVDAKIGFDEVVLRQAGEG